MKYVVEGDDGLPYPITNMFDANGNDTTDISKALSVVIKLDDDSWVTTTSDLIDIFTVH